jgi:hypothetical protein
VNTSGDAATVKSARVAAYVNIIIIALRARSAGAAIFVDTIAVDDTVESAEVKDFASIIESVAFAQLVIQMALLSDTNVMLVTEN